jgi:hypothetical protein
LLKANEDHPMARHLPLLGPAVAGLALGIAAALGPPAAAGEPPHRAAARQTPAQLNLAPVRQHAVSTAVGIGGDALATSSNQTLGLQADGRRGPAPPLNRSPSVQTAVSAAISVGGNSGALSSNNGPVALGNANGIGLTRPAQPLELGPAPRTSTAVSTAVSIGGVPIDAAR